MSNTSAPMEPPLIYLCEDLFKQNDLVMIKATIKCLGMLNIGYTQPYPSHLSQRSDIVLIIPSETGALDSTRLAAIIAHADTEYMPYRCHRIRTVDWIIESSRNPPLTSTSTAPTQTSSAMTRRGRLQEFDEVLPGDQERYAYTLEEVKAFDWDDSSQREFFKFFKQRSLERGNPWGKGVERFYKKYRGLFEVYAVGYTRAIPRVRTTRKKTVDLRKLSSRQT